MTRRFPLLSAAEEHALAVRYQATHDRAIEERLVRSHLRLVMAIANGYRFASVPIEDLIQEGSLGLLVALRRYDPARGIRLSTYAGFWIRSRILRHLLDNHRLVRVGTTVGQRRIVFRLQRARARLEQELGRSPDAAELGDRLGVDASVVESVIPHLAAVEGPLDVGEPLPAGERWRPDVLFEEEELRARVCALAGAFEARLGTRDRDLFHARWRTEDPTTLATMSHRYGISRERVRQIEARLLGRFRDYLARREVGLAA
jgi:RNA polymerase sigma-32 factor